jgi:hypothetical protein
MKKKFSRDFKKRLKSGNFKSIYPGDPHDNFFRALAKDDCEVFYSDGFPLDEELPGLFIDDDSPTE